MAEATDREAPTPPAPHRVRFSGPADAGPSCFDPGKQKAGSFLLLHACSPHKAGKLAGVGGGAAGPTLPPLTHPKGAVNFPGSTAERETR